MIFYLLCNIINAIPEIIPVTSVSNFALYEIFENEEIQELIKSRKIDEAKSVIFELIQGDFDDT